MSKRETKATEWFCNQQDGVTILEFQAVSKDAENNVSRRLLDAIVVSPGTGTRSANSEVKGKEVIVVQTKAKRLGMYLMGQAFFSAELVRRLGAKTVRTVAVCKETDALMEELCEKFGIEVVVAPACCWE